MVSVDVLGFCWCFLQSCAIFVVGERLQHDLGCFISEGMRPAVENGSYFLCCCSWVSAGSVWGSLNCAWNMTPRHGMVFPGGSRQQCQGRQHQGCTELGITYTAFGLQAPSPSLVIPADPHFSPPQDPFLTDRNEGFSSLLSPGLAYCRCVSPVERASNR